ncbi:Hypothetical predicted protein, partial [Mytilus galloprovincialis]
SSVRVLCSVIRFLNQLVTNVWTMNTVDISMTTRQHVDHKPFEKSECKLGFYRPVDHTPEKCIACMEDSYGEKCAYTCKCSPTERCNSMTGSCVSKPVAKEELTTHFDNAAVSFTSSTSTSSRYRVLSDDSVWILYATATALSKNISRHYSATRREQQHVQNIQVRNEIVGDLDDESVYNIIE